MDCIRMHNISQVQIALAAQMVVYMQAASDHVQPDPKCAVSNKGRLQQAATQSLP